MYRPSVSPSTSFVLWLNRFTRVRLCCSTLFPSAVSDCSKRLVCNEFDSISSDFIYTYVHTCRKGTRGSDAKMMNWSSALFNSVRDIYNECCCFHWRNTRNSSFIPLNPNLNSYLELHLLIFKIFNHYVNWMKTYFLSEMSRQITRIYLFIFKLII